MGRSPHSGEAARASRTWTTPLFAISIVLLMVLGGLTVLGAGASVPSARAPGTSTPAAIPAAGTTHGDLIVTAGETYTIQPVNGNPIYYQGGNITVLAGGTLNVRNVNLTFVQFIGNDTNGAGVPLTPQQRLTHIYGFSDEGTVNIYRSNVTTDVAVLNAYAKLDLVVNGSMNLWGSTLAFPGWVTVSGSSAELTLNQSSLVRNPAIATLNEPASILWDTNYAPSLSVLAGATLYLLNSTLSDTYANDIGTNGVPAPPPLAIPRNSNGDVALAGGTTTTFSKLLTPTDAENLTLDYLYGGSATPIVAGSLVTALNNSAQVLSNFTASVTYQGNVYLLPGTLAYNSTHAGQVVSVALSAALIHAINAAGMMQWLNSTCDFGATTCALSVSFTSTLGGNVNLLYADLDLEPALQYNAVANDGAQVVGVDSSLDLTFGQTPVSPVNTSAPVPWNSNKFYFLDRSTAWLFNVTLPNALQGVFAPSAFIPDESSTVNLYRWAEFNLTNITDGLTLPVAGVTASAYYAYNDNQSANATVTALNDIGTLGFPALTGYLNYWDGEHGVPAYGVSNLTGQASLLLVSSQLVGASLPYGYFLGGYHVSFRVPFVANLTWTSFAVSPYPTGVAFGSAGYQVPDSANLQVPIAPPTVDFISINGPVPAGQSLNLNDLYDTTGVIYVNGAGYATVTISAAPVGGGRTTTVAISGTVVNGSFIIAWPSLKGVLSAGTTYVFTASAVYRGATGSATIGTYSVPSSTSATGFLYQKFLGLPLWIWIAIAIAIVVAILAVLLIFRRQAAGKLVECGECGELIPEDATVCPKCGAQFESDLVRCSRCSSTIPANSQFCPECSAQLLGKPGEGGADPERQAYSDFTEKYRAESKKELGDNYTESAFWDWWKRQPTYVPFSQWTVQQTRGAPRAGMSQPPAGSESVAPSPAATPAAGAAAPAPGAGPGFTAPPPSAVPAATAAAGSLRPCPNCSKEIPPEYLVCPFCGAVTQ